MIRLKFALVLSGGGAKGIYQLGVWKALRELDIEIEAVVGTSVGALNAAFIAQDDFDTAWKAWDTMSLANIIRIPEGMIRDGKVPGSRKFRPNLKDLKEYFLQFNGLDTGPLREFITKHVNEKQIKNTGIDLGIITYNIKKLKPLEIFYSEMERNKLADYLMASASFPFFKRTEIDGVKYVDGGLYDNIPFAMVRKRGYSNIIIVDISGRGRNKKRTFDGAITVYIKNSIDMGGVFDFNPKTLNEFRNLGYLDTLKIFGKFDSINYFYQKDDKLTNKLTGIIEKILQPENQTLKEVLPPKFNLHKEPVLACMECCALTLGIDRQFQYTMQQLVDKIKEKSLILKGGGKIASNSEITNFKKQLAKKILRRSRNQKIFKYNASEYDIVLKQIFSDKKKGLISNTMDRFFPELPATRLFLQVIEDLD